MVRHLAFGCFLILASLSTEGKNKGKGKPTTTTPAAIVVDVRFGTNDISVIKQYYGAHPVSLPPGLQKKLARGKPLPPGWQKKLNAFPPHIEARLGPPCGSCGRGVIDGYGVIFDKKTAIIMDIAQLTADILR